MAQKPLNNPTLVVNNETIDIIPGSLTYNGGELEVSVKAGSSGGGKTETYHFEDASTGIGMVKFKVYNTKDIDGKIAEWKANTAINAASFFQKVGSGNAKRNFTGMSLVNSIERGTGPDGEVELEFQGDQMT